MRIEKQRPLLFYPERGAGLCLLSSEGKLECKQRNPRKLLGLPGIVHQSQLQYQCSLLRKPRTCGDGRRYITQLCLSSHFPFSKSDARCLLNTYSLMTQRLFIVITHTHRHTHTHTHTHKHVHTEPVHPSAVLLLRYQYSFRYSGQKPGS